MWPRRAGAGAHGAAPPRRDPALLPEHTRHLAPGPGAQRVHTAPDPQLLAFLLKIDSGEKFKRFTECAYFNIACSPPLGSYLLSGMDAIQNLEVLPLDELRHQKHPDRQEGEQEEWEDHLDVRPWIETKEAQTQELSNLQEIQTRLKMVHGSY